MDQDEREWGARILNINYCFLDPAYEFGDALQF